MLKTCRKPNWSSAVATTRDDRALNAIEVATGIAPWSGRSTILVIWSPDDLATFGLRTRNIITVSARATSMRTRRTWLYPRATTLTVLSRWRCGYLFVQHDLTPAQRRTLLRITPGRPELRTLREIMDQVYRLFDRRCPPATGGIIPCNAARVSLFRIYC